MERKSAILLLFGFLCFPFFWFYHSAQYQISEEFFATDYEGDKDTVQEDVWGRFKEWHVENNANDDPGEFLADIPGSSLATSGQLFSGNKVRHFPEAKRLFNGGRTFLNSTAAASSNSSSCQLTCENWAVTTTIFPPSEAVRRLMYTDLCVCLLYTSPSPRD